jgi:hypothetical protein
LHVAAKSGYKEIAEVLLASGADVNAKDLYGGTPLDEAVCRKRKDVAKLLRKHGGQLSVSMRFALVSEPVIALGTWVTAPVAEIAKWVSTSVRGGVRRFAWQRASNVDSRNSAKVTGTAMAGVKLMRNDMIGFLKDTDGKVRGLWFLEKQKASDVLTLKAAIAAVQVKEGYGTVQLSDYSACCAGLCRVQPYDGGYLVVFPSAIS